MYRLQFINFDFNKAKYILHSTELQFWKVENDCKKNFYMWCYIDNIFYNICHGV